MDGMIVVRDKDTLIRILETTEEKIEVGKTTVMQTYFNPDSNNGCQIVVNIWDMLYMMSHVGKCDDDRLADRIKEVISTLDLESDARQTLYDVEVNDDGSIDYVDIVEQYIGKPVMSYKTLQRLTKEFKKARPVGVMGHSYNVGVSNPSNAEWNNETQGDLETYKSIDIAWDEFFNWLLVDMHEMEIGPYSELTIEYVEDAGKTETDEDYLVDLVAKEIRSFDPYSFDDAGTMEENREQIRKDIYEESGKETLRTLKNIIDFEREKGEEAISNTRDVYQKVVSEVASNVDPQNAAHTIAGILMDDTVNAYKLFDNLKSMYLYADKAGKNYIDRTLTILTGKNYVEIAEAIISAE